MSGGFARFVLKCAGWTADNRPVPDKKCIFLGVPHTSIRDFVVSYFYYRSLGGKIGIMVKKEFFFWPLKYLLKALGAIPVDRSHGLSVVTSAVSAFKASETLYLGIAPEGTRSPVKRWKTGFHTIARAAGVPVYLSYFDWGRKFVTTGERFDCSDDAYADLIKIQKYYKNLGIKGLHPEKTVFLDEVDEQS